MSIYGPLLIYFSYNLQICNILVCSIIHSWKFDHEFWETLDEVDGSEPQFQVDQNGSNYFSKRFT